LFAKNKEIKMEKFKSGFVSLIGKPNVGKSTLINRLVGEKITIISPRPQTTRNIIKGIVTFDEAQIIFLDTPGIMDTKEAKTLIDKYIIKEAIKSLEGVDIILLMVNPLPPSEEDKFILQKLKEFKKIAFLVINKIDKAKKDYLKELSKIYCSFFPFTEVIPISAKKGTNLSILVGKMIQYLPYHEPYYSSDLITDQPERILVAELIREKIYLLTHQEIPYSAMVKVEQFKERKGNLIYIKASIYVEHVSQKGILVGKKGKMIKEIGKLAREDIEKHLGCKVYIDLWVRVKKEWRKHAESFKELGYKI